MFEKKTKIVVTMGPALSTEDKIREAILAGADAFRLNFSHGDHKEHYRRFTLVRKISEELGKYIPIIQDIQGPKIRIRDVKDDGCLLEEGQIVLISSKKGISDCKLIYVDYEYLEKDIQPGACIFIDDGKIKLEVVEVSSEGVVCKVIAGGVVKSHKGVNIIGVDLTVPSITEKDKEDVLFGIKIGVDYIAQSFVRKPDDVMELRNFLMLNGGKGINIIAKIEKYEAVENLESIILVSDAVLIARGDLGVEIPIEEVPIVQKRIIKTARKYARPVITATQMLESMISSPMPTRAEATDVANAIFDGTDAVMLSGETSVGKYPIETIKTMTRIIKRAEKSLVSGEVPYYERIEPLLGFTDAIGLATCELANTTGAKAIITSTESGKTARLVAKYKPHSFIVAASPHKKTLRKIGIVWGTYPLYIPPFSSVDALLTSIIDEAGKKGYLSSGDIAVITAGDFVGVEGTTNLIKIATYTPVVARGIGIGSGLVVGRITRGDSEGEVLVLDDLNSLDSIDGNIRVIIVKKKDFNVNSDILYKVPLVIGVGDDIDNLKDGTLVTIDIYRGVIYGGQILRPG